MIRINNISLKPVKCENHTDLVLRLKKQARNILHINDNDIENLTIVKKSIDARKKSDILVICTVDIILKKDLEKKILSKNKNNKVVKSNPVIYDPMISHNIKCDNRPVVIGAGPAGLFCAYVLALNGLKPIVIERGSRADIRKEEIENFWNTGKLNLHSNVQFGEGGAGTFSDGKLNTQVKDKTGRINFVLKTFVNHGADENILYDQRPHVGTDRLIEIISNLRNEIISLGGEFKFNTLMSDISIEGDTLKGITVISENSNEQIATNHLALCIGHSARDTIKMLFDNGLNMESKSFATGLRVIHSQDLINKSQYGDFFDYFGSAPYKLTYNTDTRGVFSFCMCPGGYVVNASSEDKMLAVNGMSYSDRASGFANSAIVITVTPDDFESNHPLSGIKFQQEMEKKAYIAGDGNIPIQIFKDYKNNVNSKELNTSCIKGKTKATNLRGIMKSDLEDAFINGMQDFGRKIKGFDADDVLIAGVESRTSSPVRINRDENLLSNVKGIYPGGEGAGYAGGITSAAVDGLRLAEAIIKSYE